MAIIKYRAHCANFGWQAPVEDGQIAGTVGENRALECYRIEELNVPGEADMNVHAFAHVQDLGWSAGNTKGEDVGSTGLGKHIEAVKMGLIGESAGEYDIWYRLHVADRGFLNWSKNGEVNGTIGGNVQAEAIQIEVHAKSENWYPYTDRAEKFMDLTPPPAPAQSGSRPSILEIARSHVGYISGSEDDSAFGRRLVGPFAGNWCCFFCVCCAQDAGLDVIETGYCPYMMDWAKENGRWSATPQPGYFVLYDWDGNGVPNHIGIVEEVYSQWSVCAIEGNTGNPVGVYRKDRSSGILGYVNPF